MCDIHVHVLRKFDANNINIKYKSINVIDLILQILGHPHATHTRCILISFLKWHRGVRMAQKLQLVSPSAAPEPLEMVASLILQHFISLPISLLRFFKIWVYPQEFDTQINVARLLCYCGAGIGESLLASTAQISACKVKEINILFDLRIAMGVYRILTLGSLVLSAGMHVECTYKNGFV